LQNATRHGPTLEAKGHAHGVCKGSRYGGWGRNGHASSTRRNEPGSLRFEFHRRGGATDLECSNSTPVGAFGGGGQNRMGIDPTEAIAFARAHGLAGKLADQASFCTVIMKYDCIRHKCAPKVISQTRDIHHCYLHEFSLYLIHVIRTGGDCALCTIFRTFCSFRDLAC
jgi:hypothetical protein